MSSNCGKCKYFKKNPNSIIGRCDNTLAKIRNKSNRTALSKSCFWYDGIYIEKDINEFTEQDLKILKSLLNKFEKDYPTKLNSMRANAIRHLYNDYNNLRKEVLRNDK